MFCFMLITSYAYDFMSSLNTMYCKSFKVENFLGIQKKAVIHWKTFTVRRQSCIDKAYCTCMLFRWKSFTFTDQSTKTKKLFHLERFTIYSI